MVYITLDFGSSNSGAILNTAGREYNPSDLIWVHRQDGDAGFTKQPTVFLIKRSLLEKTNVSEGDINIYSCVFNEENFLENANFIWCKKQIMKVLPELIKNEEWECLRHPKMELYRLDNHSPADILIQAKSGNSYILRQIIKIFFFVVKKECLYKAKEIGLTLDANNINWSITVPGLAIWNQDAVGVIRDVAHSVFGEKITLLSEPECALIGINLSGKTELSFVKDRYSLIVDLGGGTSDICVMQENLNSDGTTTFDEIKSTFGHKDSTTSERVGGNDIDDNFKSFFCESLAKDIEMWDTSIWLYSKFFKDDPEGAMEFDDNWHKLQFSDKIEKNTIYFNPGRAYNEWLMRNCPAAARKKDDYGEFSFDGKELRDKVFNPIYEKILKLINENLSVLKNEEKTLDVIYFAGGLSLSVELKKRIKSLSVEYFPFVRFIESSEGSVVGAVQRGGNHIAVNKDTLIRRMSRKTFYLELGHLFKDNMSDLKDFFKAELRKNYSMLSETEINEKLDSQWNNKTINYSNGEVMYYTPLCLRFTPVTQIKSLRLKPINPGNQTKIIISVFSSDKNFILFKNEDMKEEGEFVYDFGYNWESTQLFFDPKSNAVEGTALLYLADENGKKLKEIVIQNVSKRGF